MVLKLQLAPLPPGGLLKHKLLGLNPRIAASVDLGLDQGIQISNKFPGDGYDTVGDMPEVDMS